MSKVFFEATRLANSYTRLPILLDVLPADNLDRFPAWLEVLGDEWVDCDNISSYKGELLQVLAKAQESGLTHLLMTEDEQQALAALPDSFTVYRGCYENNREGLSWTTSREVAEGFTELTRYQQAGQKPLLIERVISRSEVIAYKLEREEYEIILLPKERK